MLKNLFNWLYTNILFVHIIVLIAIISSFIILINKKKYDGAIALFIVAIVYIVFAFIL